LQAVVRRHPAPARVAGGIDRAQAEERPYETAAREERAIGEDPSIDERGSTDKSGSTDEGRTRSNPSTEATEAANMRCSKTTTSVEAASASVEAATTSVEAATTSVEAATTSVEAATTSVEAATTSAAAATTVSAAATMMLGLCRSRNQRGTNHGPHGENGQSLLNHDCSSFGHLPTVCGVAG